MQRQKWVSRIGPARPDSPVLICFPHAGAGASTFWRWRPHLPPDIEMWAAQLPGREERMEEPRFTTIPPLVDALVDGLRGLLNRPYGFFGHSLGALVAFELARALHRRGEPSPRFVAVSAMIAPQLFEPTAIRDKSTEEMLSLLAQMHPPLKSLTPGARAIAESMVQVVHDDVAMAGRYRYVADAPLPCPLIAFGGTDDPLAEGPGLASWRTQTRSDFACTVFPGDHFYLFDHAPKLLAQMSARLVATP